MKSSRQARQPVDRAVCEMFFSCKHPLKLVRICFKKQNSLLKLKLQRLSRIQFDGDGHFPGFDRKYLFSGKYDPKNQNCLFKLMFDSWNNSKCNFKELNERVNKKSKNNFFFINTTKIHGTHKH